MSATTTSLYQQSRVLAARFFLIGALRNTRGDNPPSEDHSHPALPPKQTIMLNIIISALKLPLIAGL